MNSEVDVFHGTKTLDITAENIRKYIPNANQAKDDELTIFLNLCTMYKLNPFKREIYFIKYGNNTPSIVTGYETFLKRAERTGNLNGWYFEDDQVIDTDGKRDYKVTLVIHRKDWTNPFKHTVYFSEVAQKKHDGTLNTMWQKMPRFMTKKTCISQGFRMCFPDEFGGMPYTDAEMGIETAQIETAQYEVIDGNGNGNGNENKKPEIPKPEIKKADPKPEPIKKGSAEDYRQRIMNFLDPLLDKNFITDTYHKTIFNEISHIDDVEALKRKIVNINLEMTGRAKGKTIPILQDGHDNGYIANDKLNFYNKRIEEATTLDQVRELLSRIEADISHAKELEAAQAELGI